MKKILVIGANGRVGSQLVQKLADRGHSVLAGARENKGEPYAQSIEYKYLNLLDDVDTIATAMAGVDAVYFVSGSRGKDLLQVDLHGAIKTMQAAEKARVNRYIMLSSVFALQPNRWGEAHLKEITDYNIAKHYADLYLTTQTALDYTILQPGHLMETQGTGKIAINVTRAGENPIQDVVETLVAILDVNVTVGKVIMMHEGDTAIREALKELAISN